MGAGGILSVSRAQQRTKRKIKRKAKIAQRLALVDKINSVVHPTAYVVGLGPLAVGVQGDARTYGIAVVLRFLPDTSSRHIGEVSNEVTNRVSEVTRVLMDIPLLRES